jgi:outer membrane protein OmpA-like peptidoglycan-associated protein
MNSIKIFGWSTLFALTLTVTHAKHVGIVTTPVEPHYVVVIGAFSVHRNAERFTNRAQDLKQILKYDAKYEFNPDRNLYYVFTLATENKDMAMTEAKRLRDETTYQDAWVYYGIVGEAGFAKQQDINPVTEQKMEQVPETKMPEPELATQATNTEAVPEGKKFFFTLTNATDNRVVKGEVDAIDVDRKRKIATYKSEQVVYLESPKSQSGKVTLVSNIFGYRKTQKDIDYNNPEGEGITVDETGSVVIPFQLVRLQKGDIVVMYQVFFYKDAAVMLPESRYEVDNLLDLMKENQKCKIMIHGHTNGNSSGKIISIGESKNFFSLTDTKESLGTAKALSEARATIIRDYLVENGIDSKRMEVKAWGGKRSLYDKDSPNAKDNVRVEIEILED